MGIQGQEVHTDNIFQCDFCILCVKTSRALKTHKRDHECGTFKKAVEAKLKIHIKTVHERPTEVVSVTCVAKSLNGHLESYRQSHEEKEKNFKCGKYPWTFYISSAPFLCGNRF
ncbi:unnamed protein product [Chironomus riparius]|uniref:C2H2-type domain-containing protein n=1 Tax=Chironomus riparius TaxID=315576 RepID=A0A9N9S6D8_9DIPT|nr:unnamed protein product [Chironomus riparius]